MKLLRALFRCIPDPKAGYEDTWVFMHIVLPEPTVVPSEPGDSVGVTEAEIEADAADQMPVIGYYRTVGIRARSNELQQMLEQFVDDGRIDWSDTKWKPTNPNRHEFSIRRLIKMPESAGVWYRSGKVYYGGEDHDA